MGHDFFAPVSATGRLSSCLEDKLVSHIEQILFQAYRILMRIGKALDTVMEPIELRQGPIPHSSHGRWVIYLLALPEDRYQQIL